MTNQLETPVVLIVFNRPEKTRIVFRTVAAVRPQKLLIIADGPRASRPDDDSLCRETRSIAREVDWPCEVLTNFAESNLGCCERVVSGLNWAFSLVSEAIILEDDCLPHTDFFRFCEEMLDRYRTDERVGGISATNFDQANRTTEYSYYFSQVARVWGWATWRRAWERYDRDMSHWKAVQRAGVLHEIWSNPRSVLYWSQIFEGMYEKTGPNTWDYQWIYTKLVNSMMSIVPSVNMVRNIGFGGDATHTLETPRWARGLQESPIEFPLKHPPYVIPMRSFDDLDMQVAYLPTFSERAIGKARRVISRAIPVLRQGPATS